MGFERKVVESQTLLYKLPKTVNKLTVSIRHSRECVKSYDFPTFVYYNYLSYIYIYPAIAFQYDKYTCLLYAATVLKSFSLSLCGSQKL